MDLMFFILYYVEFKKVGFNIDFKYIDLNLL